MCLETPPIHIPAALDFAALDFEGLPHSILLSRAKHFEARKEHHALTPRTTQGIPVVPE